MIIAVAFVAYAPALRNGFVWDDTALVLRDPLIRSWRLIPEGFRHFLFLDATASNFYRPLQRLTFTADYAAWGFANPGGWHFTSIAIHAAAAVALYALLRRWLGEERRRWALGIALVWAIHPLHTSAVTYISGRADPLAALCGFTGLWFALRAEKRAQLYAALCFLGALLSKESGGVFLLIWLALIAWRRVPPRAVILAVGVLAIYLPLRLTANKTPPPQSTPTPLIARPILAARAVAEYTGLLIAPVNLRMERDVATRPSATPEASRKNARLRECQTLLGALLIAGLIAWFRRADRDTRFALLAAAIAYLPISNITPLNATVAEHWLYVPSAFLLAAIGLAKTRARIGRDGCPQPSAQADKRASSTTLTAEDRGPYLPLSTPQRCAIALALVWTSCLATRTWLRQPDWRDQRTFLTRTIAAGGDSARMHVNLGNLEAAEAHPDRALAEYAEALRRDPKLSFAHLGIAAAQLKLRHFAEARAALDRADESPSLEAEKLQLRAALDHADWKMSPVFAYGCATEFARLNWPIYRRYVTALAQFENTSAAASELRSFLETQDFRADSWLLLAELYTRMNQPALAKVARAEARKRDVRLP